MALRTLADLVDDLSQHGEAPAVVEMGAEGPRATSFAELDRRVARGVAGLRERELRPGDRVVLWAENSAAWVAAALAVLRAGGIVTPLDVQLGREALARILEDGAPRFLCITAGRRRRLEEVEGPPWRRPTGPGGPGSPFATPWPAPSAG